MKTPRSFSLLTFLLLSGVVALSVAIYSANNEVAETKAKFKEYGEEMGFFDVDDDTKLNIRRLGGYPQMSFAFRYQLPRNQSYMLRIGSGVVDPATGFPLELARREISNSESQGTLIVSLQKMPTNFGTTWTIQHINGNSLQTKICDDANEFTWLQTYLAAFPTDDQMGNGSQFFTNLPSAVEGHQTLQTFEPDKVAMLYSKGEFHPSAMDSIPKEILKARKMFMIWLEPMIPDAK